MSVVLSPSGQLGFPRPLTQLVKRQLMIHNPHASPVAFKVKTTAPKQYCVRPNSGRVEPGETVIVEVLLQPLAVDPPPHAKCKDKFLVQSAFIAPDGEMRTLPEMWAEVEKKDRSAIQEQKIRCAFLPADDGSAPTNGIAEEDDHAGEASRIEDSPEGYTRWTTAPDRVIDPSLFPNGGYSDWVVPKPKVKVPAPVIVPAPSVPTVVFPAPAPPVLEVKIEQPAKEGPQVYVLPIHAIFSAAEQSPIPSHTTPRINGDPTTPTAASSPPAPGLSAPTAASGTAREIPSLSAAEVQAAGAPTNTALEQGLVATTSEADKLALALKEVDRLRAQLAEAQAQTTSVTGLRRRGVPGDAADKVADKAGAVAQAVQQQSAQGVPLEVVAGLVVGVFVLTYLFF
ncbi:phosphatidylinositol-binding protein scs2 [Cryptotrichosporon argae]